MGYERKSEPMMLAPGANRGASALRLPGAGEAGVVDGLPGVDEHLVEPEISREEVVRGRRMQALPARAPHGDMHAHLSGVVAQFVVSDYVASTDLQTRFGPKSDFATDVCVRRRGLDATTGSRYLEEVCFEVVYTQSLRDITNRAEDVIARGVRRMFAIFVKGIGRGENALLDEKATVVKEWLASEKRWVAFGIDQEIEDACFVRPIAVRALVDAAAADDEILRALRAKGNRALAQMQEQAFHDGRADGLRDGRAEGLRDGRAKELHLMIARLLERQGIHLQAAQKAQLAACMDCEVLRQWLERVLDGDIPEELML